MCSPAQKKSKEFLPFACQKTFPNQKVATDSLAIDSISIDMCTAPLLPSEQQGGDRFAKHPDIRSALPLQFAF
jgi:hypothetical protein